MYIINRIREILKSLNSDKKRLADVLLHSMARRTLGETFADEYIKITDANSSQFNQKDLLIIRLILEAINIMTNNDTQKALAHPAKSIQPYLSEAFDFLLKEDNEVFEAYVYTNNLLPKESILTEASFVETYAEWIEKTSDYLSEVRSVLRIVSYNELSTLWESAASTKYLATHHALISKRHCDLRRAFIYDATYWLNPELLKRLLVELAVQRKIGINVRVCSSEQLVEKGKGYYYPLDAFGTYDRKCLAVSIPHPTRSFVNFIHKEKQVKDAIDVFDGIYDSAEPAETWANKHRRISKREDDDVIKYRVKEIVKLSKAVRLT